MLDGLSKLQKRCFVATCENSSACHSHRTYLSWQHITQAKVLFPDTTLVDSDGARAVIVSPDRAAYLAQARRIQRAISKLTGTKLPIRLDRELDPWTPPTCNVLLLGNLCSNKMIPPLYAMHYVAADSFYPGRGGYVLRTVHDPWGNGCNAILMGGSDIYGVMQSVDRFVTALEPSSEGLSVPPLLDVSLATSLVEQLPLLGAEPNEEFIESQMAKAHEMLETSAHGGITEPLSQAGFYYYLTGKAGWAELFKRLVYLMYEDFRRGRNQYGGPWGMDADFRLHKMVPAWDLVEEASTFTSEDRLNITRIYGEFIRDCVPHADAAVQNRLVRHNHCTFAALGLMYAGFYFQKYYGVAEANDWLYIADECFQPQCHGARPIEDSNGYQWLTLFHTTKYALARPYLVFFENGHMRQVCDLIAASMDNLGYQSSYGDTRSPFGWGTEMPLLSTAAWFYGDGTYQWLLARHRESATHHFVAGPIGTYNADVEPVEPTDHSALACVPLDQRFYESAGGPEVLPRQKAFDKIAFRDGFDPQGEYLLLNGLSCGGHKHYDGNSFIRLTALGRIWLADCDYYSSTPNFHNSVLPSRAGYTTTMPPFVWREIVADLDGCGFTRTVAKDYASTNWERNVVWRKGSYFLVIDVMRALADDEYRFRALWRVLGDVEVGRGVLTARQQDKALSIINVDGAAIALKQDEITSSNWTEYPFAQPMVHVAQEDKTSALKCGEAAVFLNVLQPHPTDESPLPTRRVGPADVLVQEPEAIAWLGARVSADANGPCATDAALWYVRPTSYALVNATYLSRDTSLFASDRPVSIEFDLLTGRGVVDAGFATLLTLRAIDPESLSIDGRERAFKATDSSVTFSVPEGRHTIALRSRPDEEAIVELTGALSSAWETARSDEAPRRPLPKNVTPDPAWQALHGATVTCISALTNSREDLLVAADQAGHVYLLTASGEIVWERRVDGGVTTLTTASFGPDMSAIVVGSNACSVTCFNLNGEESWRYEVPFYKRDGIVRVLMAADLNGDGCDEVIVGAENWHYYALTNDGTLLWQYESVHASTAAEVADIDGDGYLELLAGTEYYWWHCVSHTGERKWQHNTVYGPGARVVATPALKNGRHLVAYGGRDGTVQVVDHEGHLRFVLRTADQIVGLASVDLDNDGNEELVVASAINYVYANKADGSTVWRVATDDTPRHLLIARSQPGSPEIVVAQDSGVVFRLRADGSIAEKLDIGGSAETVALAMMQGNLQLVASFAEDGLKAWKL